MSVYKNTCHCESYIDIFKRSKLRSFLASAMTGNVKLEFQKCIPHFIHLYMYLCVCGEVRWSGAGGGGGGDGSGGHDDVEIHCISTRHQKISQHYLPSKQ